MARKNRILQPVTRGNLDRFKYETAHDVGNRLNAGDSRDIKTMAEQTGNGMVDKMAEDHEIKAQNSGFPTDNS